MLIQLMFVRMIPLISCVFLKEYRSLKKASIIWMAVSLWLLMIVILEMIEKYGWKTLVYVPIACFPQGVFYGWAAIIILRGIWMEWSERVRRRIYLLSALSIAGGVWMECCLNPIILQIFLKNL